MIRVAGDPGLVTLRADDPVDGRVLATFTAEVGEPYAYVPLRSDLADAGAVGMVDLYLVCGAPGIIVSELTFA